MEIFDDGHQFAGVHNRRQTDFYMALAHTNHVFKIIRQFRMESEYFLALIKEDTACVGQGDLFLCAVKEGHPKLCFNILYRFTDCRLGNVKVVRRPGHTAVFYNRHEITHMLDIDGNHFLSGQS